MGKFNNIIFRNYFNHGDLHVCRSFIQYFINNIHGYPFKLNHPRSKNTLGDLNIPVFWNSNQKPRTFDNRGYHIQYNTLIINTQYLAYNNYHFNKHRATLLTLWGIFNQTLNEVFNMELPKDYKQFLPKINYNSFKIDNIDIEIKNNPKRKILICNNNFESNQSMNFNFDPVILELSQTFPEITFYITNKSNVINDNIVYVTDIIGEMECDLNEISYLSLFCDILIGRNSGPHTFCYTSDNLLNIEKKFISFSPPSSLYGGVPEKWIDFGVKAITDKSECAQFFNIVKISDKERVFEICKIIGDKKLWG